MHLLPDQLMFGVAPDLLIDCARQIHEGDYDDKKHAFDVEAFSRALGAPVSESGPVLQVMLADGLFERAEGEGSRYIATRKLGQLALASISHGISRDEAGTFAGLGRREGSVDQCAARRLRTPDRLRRGVWFLAY